jgi:hypothetical protein
VYQADGGRRMNGVTPIRNASIATFTVNVRVMQINNKQVTQSVFKQMDEQFPFVPPDWTPVGNLWGRVNYYFDDCKGKDRNSHLHIVWDLDGQIYRTCLDSLPNSNDSVSAIMNSCAVYREKLSQTIAGLLYLRDRPVIEWIQLYNNHGNKIGSITVPSGGDPLLAAIEKIRYILKGIKPDKIRHEGDRAKYDEAVEVLRDRLAEKVAEFRSMNFRQDWEIPTNDIEFMYKLLINHDEYVKHLNDSFDEMFRDAAELPLLFIAV